MDIHRIDGPSGPGRVEGPRLTPTGLTPPTSMSPAGDSVEISQAARLGSALTRVPEVRTEKIRSLREQIARGEYESDEKFRVAIERFLEEIGAA